MERKDLLFVKNDSLRFKESNKNSNYAIFVNTCDSYDDCWFPFFQLFKVFWQNNEQNIYLNTETKIYQHEGLELYSIQCSKEYNVQRNGQMPWGERFKNAINYMTEDIILYLQEDYFIKDFVQTEIIEDFVELMKLNADIGCIHLTDQALSSLGPSEFKNLNEVKIKQRYRISLQAALWRKDVLLDYLKDSESIWDFEEFGSLRAGILTHRFLVVNKDFVKLDRFEIIPYIFTGINQGKWLDQVVPLFESQNINIDYSIRGFKNNDYEKPFIQKVKYHIRRTIKLMNHYFYMVKFKLSK